MKVSPPLTKKPPEDGNTGVDQVDQAKHTEDQTKWWVKFIEFQNESTANFCHEGVKTCIEDFFCLPSHKIDFCSLFSGENGNGFKAKKVCPQNL